MFKTALVLVFENPFQVGLCEMGFHEGWFGLGQSNPISPVFRWPTKSHVAAQIESSVDT